MSENRGFKYGFGDVIKIAGDNRKFIVDSLRLETTYYIDDLFEDKIYELTCISDGTYTEVEEEMVTEKIGTYNDDADDWDDIDEDDESGKIYYVIQLNENGEAEVVNNERKLTPREESSKEAERRKQERKDRAAQVDALLDELNDCRALFENFGDREYAEQAASIMTKLTELTE